MIRKIWIGQVGQESLKNMSSIDLLKVIGVLAELDVEYTSDRCESVDLNLNGGIYYYTLWKSGQVGYLVFKGSIDEVILEIRKYYLGYRDLVSVGKDYEL